MRLVLEPEVILTKNSVMGKVMEMMAGLSEAYRPVWEGAAGAKGGAPMSPDARAGSSSPKISRGENYLGLPWVILDYPRFFGREDVFAIRTMFWWGHAFTVTLHLKGRYLELHLPVIERHWMVLARAGFHVGLSTDEWRHEHVANNYGVLEGPEGLRQGRDFLKLSAAVALSRWDDALVLMTDMFKTLMTVLF